MGGTVNCMSCGRDTSSSTELCAPCRLPGITHISSARDHHSAYEGQIGTGCYDGDTADKFDGSTFREERHSKEPIAPETVWPTDEELESKEEPAKNAEPQAKTEPDLSLSHYGFNAACEAPELQVQNPPAEGVNETGNPVAVKSNERVEQIERSFDCLPSREEHYAPPRTDGHRKGSGGGVGQNRFRPGRKFV